MSESKFFSESGVLTLNKRAMEKLRSCEYQEAFRCLSEAENFLKSFAGNEQLWAITLNNLGCYYKRTGKLQEALSCLNQALDLERKSGKDLVNLSGTHLNISAIYSQLNVHESALSHAIKALKVLKTCQDRNANMWTTQIIAHHSAGLEYEFLFRVLEAMNMYKKGWELGKEKLGENHALTLSLKKNLMKISQENQSAENFTIQRASRVSTRKPKTSSSRYMNRKTPVSVPPSKQRESFPNIYDNLPMKENLSGFYSTEKTKGYRHTAHSIEKYRNTVLVPPKRQIQVINKKKYDALREIVEELEANMPNQNGFTENFINFRNKIKPEDAKNMSVGVQAEFSVKKNLEKISVEMPSIGKKNLSVKKKEKEKFSQKVQEAGLKAIEAMKEVERLKTAKIQLEKKEKVEKESEKDLIPIPSKSKIEFFKRKSLQTIYESRYEDKLEPLILIQSHIRSWLARKHYKKIYKAVITLQSYIKMRTTKELYKHILQAAIFIQAMFRGHRVRKLYNFLLNPC